MCLLVLACIFGQLGFQEPKATKLVDQSNQTAVCSQTPEERELLIREAVENEFTIRRVEFLGNLRTKDSVLRRRISLPEGDPLKRENLVKSLKDVSKLKKIIYPVALDDVVIISDRPNRIVDMMICFKEKRK